MWHSTTMIENFEKAETAMLRLEDERQTAGSEKVQYVHPSIFCVNNQVLVGIK